MSATAAMDARTLLGLLGRGRRRLRRARGTAPRHAEYRVGFGPPGRARPRRQSQSAARRRSGTSMATRCLVPREHQQRRGAACLAAGVVEAAQPRSNAARSCCRRRRRRRRETQSCRGKQALVEYHQCQIARARGCLRLREGQREMPLFWLPTARVLSAPQRTGCHSLANT